MNAASGTRTESPPAYAVVIATLLAILSLSAATASAQESDYYESDVGLESDYFADEPDSGFFDFGDEGFGNDAAGDDNGFVDLDEDIFNFDADYGQNYDDQFVSDRTGYQYQQDRNAFETDEDWFEDWYDGEDE